MGFAIIIGIGKELLRILPLDHGEYARRFALTFLAWLRKLILTALVVSYQAS